MNTENSEQSTRLESWKEIGAYLQRDVRTMRRWEKEEGLPIHRHSHKVRGSVYAFTGEIDAWRASRKVAAEPEPAGPLWRMPAFAATLVLSLVMVGSGMRTVSAQSGVVKRLVFSGDGIPTSASFTPDGKRMVFDDWIDGQDLVIRDVSGGPLKRMLANTRPDPRAGVSAPALSPDQRQIAYHAYSPEAPDGELRIMENKVGGKSRVLLKGNAFPEAWFPDGKSILVARRTADRQWQYERVLVSDGAVRVLKQLEGRLTSVSSGPQISPDGRYVGYAALAVNPINPPTGLELARNGIKGDRHIYVLASDGSSEAEIVKTSGSNLNPVWTPDGKHLLFTSDRSGKVDLWSIPMQNGRAAGEPKVLRAEIGDIYAFGIFRGSYLYEHRQPVTDYVHVVETVAAGGVREIKRFVGTAPSWSPDGKSIAFKRRHPGIADAYDLAIHSVDTGDERTIPTSFGTSGGGLLFRFHDGRSLVTGFGHTAPRKPYRIDLETGEFKEMPAEVPFPLSFSPDDRTVYVVRREAGKPDRVVAVELSTGQERQILVSPAVGETQGLGVALSPDGRTLALVWLDRMRASEGGAQLHVGRVAVDGSGYRELLARTDHLYGGGVAWSSDGRSILFRQEQPEGASHWGVMRISADGGSPSLVFAHEALGSFDPGPDGTRFAFATRESPDELWALDNILSAIK